MAKKRTTPPINPLKQDLVASVVSAPAPAPPKPIDHVVPDEKVAVPTSGRQAQPSRKKRVGKSQPKARRSSPQQEKKNTQWTEPGNVQLKARVSDQDAEVIRAMVRRLGEKTDSNPSDSSVARALWSLFMLIEDEIEELPQTPLHKPGYADKNGNAIYEDELARLIHKCLRRLPASSSDRSGPLVRSRTQAS